MNDTIMGFRRADGKFGVRNYVVVISLIHCANTVSDRIGQQCNVPSITMDWGCGEANPKSEARTNLGMIRAGQSPNVYGVLLVSLGCQWTNPDEIASQIRKTGKRVEHLCIQEEGGMTPTIERGVAIVKEMQEEAARQQREPFPMSELVIGATCGGSDWTSSINGNTCEGVTVDMLFKKGVSFIDWGIRGLPGAEIKALELAADYEVGKKLIEISREFRHEHLKKTGQSVSEVNPSPGNMEGGISTLTEKTLSNFEIKGTTPIQGILEVGESVPAGRPGTYVMNHWAGGNDVYQVTAIAMSGAHAILLHTGRGNPLGCAVSPVIKLTGNPHTATYLEEMIDYTSKDVLTGEKTLQQTGQELYDLTIEVLNGKKTKAELFGEYSYTAPPIWE